MSILFVLDQSDCETGTLRLSNTTHRSSVSIYDDDILVEGILQTCSSSGIWGSSCGSITPKGAWDVCGSFNLSKEGRVFI